MILIGSLAYMIYKKPAPIVVTATPMVSATITPTDFNIVLPAGYTMTSPDDGIYTIEDQTGTGMQISITAFDEPGPITEERIRQDLPDAVIDEPGQAKLDGELSFIFYGFDEDMGDTFEVWAVHGGKLYQIMGAKEQEKEIETILNTWKWK